MDHSLSSQREQYDREFELEAMALVVDQGRSVADVAKSLGVCSSVLHAWKKKYVADGAAAIPGHGRLKPDDEEIRKLKRELAQVR